MELDTVEEVIIQGETPLNILAIIAEMRESGYKQRIDYDFSYHPAEYIDCSWVPKFTVFKFYTAGVASWFALKYGNGQKL